MIVLDRKEALKKFEEWAEEAENGNYHDLCGALFALCIEIREMTDDDLPITIWTIKSTDEYPSSKNIVKLYINK